MATLVKFRVNEKYTDSDIFAYFPKLKADLNGCKTSYSHVGQHSACSPAYEKESRPATKEEYLPLKKELESIGYNLKICK